ncbi:MAG: CHASE2 domain-containing protein [Nitrospirae bacterium]|nr:CHASE2 domain-containing protein [Nitrospirota bacterium]
MPLNVPFEIGKASSFWGVLHLSNYDIIEAEMLVPGLIRKYVERFPKALRGAIIGLCAGVLALILGMFQFAVDLELYTVDLRYKNRPPIKTLPELGYIDFGDSSLQLFGQWPWTRLRHVVLVKTLNFYNARQAGYDVFFIERENTAFYPSVITKFFSTPSPSANNTDAFLRILDDSFRNYDEEFAEAMSKYGNIYLSYFTIRAKKDEGQDASSAVTTQTTETIQSEALTLLEKTFLPIPATIDPAGLFADIRIDPPLEEFISSAKGVGFAQPVLDSDSIVRNYTLLRRYNDNMTYSIIIRMLSDTLDFKPSEMEVAPGEYLTLKNALPYGSTNRQDIKIPIDAHCQMLLNWAGPFHNTYTHIPYDLISHYYAVIRAKQIASTYNGNSYTVLYNDIYLDLMEDNLVSEANAKGIASDIATALFVSKYLDKGVDKTEIYSRLQPYASGDTIEQVYSVVAAAFQIALLLEKGHTINDASFSAKFHNNAFAPQIDEALKNMKWFYAKGRIRDAYPYYFPGAATVAKQGRRKAFSPVDMENMIFMIGLTGTNTMDLNPTPYEPSAPMVSFHLNAINSILTGQFLDTAPASFNRAITLVLSVMVAAVGIMSGVIVSFALAATVAAAYTFSTYKLWSLKGYRIDLVLPLMGIALAYISVLVIQFVRVFLERRKVRSIFAKMVSPALLKVMEEKPGSFSLTGERKGAAVFFSALNGMNEAIGKVSPNELPGLLSIYLSPSSEIIMNYGGYIDKYEGHVIMADFGVPIEDELCATRCAFSAIEQRLDIEAFRFYAETAYGLSVSVAMGFNYGYVSAGNMGSEEKFQYTVMGDPVNVAARFMAANFIYNSDYALTGEDTAPVISDSVHLRLLDKLLLKGKANPTTIYECIGWRPEAYLRLHAEKPVPQHLKDLWIKSPTGKIFGYLQLWEKIYKKTSHPLAQMIQTFFAESIPIVEPLLINEWKKEAITIYTSIGALKNKLKATLGYDFSANNAGEPDSSANLPDLLSLRVDETKRVARMLEDTVVKKAIGGAAVEELASEAAALLNKCEIFLSRLRKEHTGNEHIIRCTDALAGIIPENEAAQEEQLNALIADGQSRYKARAADFYKQVSAKHGPWHEMMALAGAPTKDDLTASVHFGEALKLYWERRWDSATEEFKKVLQIIPHDSPAQSFIGRIKSYKESPPADSWQGEFVQTKK